MIGESAPRRASVAVLQVILGLILGPLAVWTLVNGLPIQSGQAVVGASAAITLVAAVSVWALVRVVRPAAVAFALGAAATSLLLAVVVVS